MRKPTFWFSTGSNTNQAVQLQKMARGLLLRILKAEELYYLCSENKEADLRLCFWTCKSWISHDTAQLIFGQVKNKLDGQVYAIKRIPLNPKSQHFNKKITREVKLLSRLNHENVVR